ncbi:ATP-binding protein [Alloscardovia venturai]|uniref:ATP-binding protein n=1 Tax=Alloscardovia venturai TaxID=1769421 RepID=A0ABW2Y6R2_9BIFI
MIPRTLAAKLLTLAEGFPVVTVNGPRQSGKSTLVKNTFPNYRYISLEDPDIRSLASEDPRGFLQQFNSHIIFDEIQRVPELFPYLQGIVDSQNNPGQFILSGSQNFLLLKKISQSLAGRVGILHLLPLAYSEMKSNGASPNSIMDWVFTGGYPRLYSSHIHPTDFFPNYISTYIDRDIREELGVKKINEFNTFLKLCATRTGEVLNLTSLANDCDISTTTAREWLSILEASFVCFQLHPYHKNYGKRLIKAPKFYFYDTGLAANLLGINSPDELFTSVYRGNLFENAVVVELIKQYTSVGREPELFYWRDSNQNEIDFITQKAGKPYQAIEVKSTSTYKAQAFRTIDEISPLMGINESNRFVIYSGDTSMKTSHGQLVSFTDINAYFHV